MTPRYLDFSKPAPAYDEETGEYAGFWWVDGEKVEAPEHASGNEIEALRTH